METKKESFYKTLEEKMLKMAVDSKYNDYVGGEENHYLDCGERYFGFTEESLIETITDEILKTKTHIWLDNGFALEAKHIRFIGKARVHEIVDHRVKYRHAKEGWEWER